MNKAKELKKCPFCGGGASYDCDSTVDISWSLDNVKIICTQCECQTELVWCTDRLSEKECDSCVDKVCKIWNSRI